MQKAKEEVAKDALSKSEGFGKIFGMAGVRPPEVLELGGRPDIAHMPSASRSLIEAESSEGRMGCSLAKSYSKLPCTGKVRGCLMEPQPLCFGARLGEKPLPFLRILEDIFSRRA